jgi:HAD superfamily hydrolase (TIGR01549 family)
MTRAHVYKHIIFDFDGVLADTNAIRIEGFQILFKDFPVEELRMLNDFVKINGGISRYKKIQYFFEDVLKESITESDIHMWAQRYSDLVKQKVIDAPAIKGSIDFLSQYFQGYDFSIISGSDQEELRDVCRARKIEQFFIEILGSPDSKEANMAQLLKNQEWNKKNCVFIGDSINDIAASNKLGIDFIGLNSGMADWNQMEDVRFIEDFTQLSMPIQN